MNDIEPPLRPQISFERLKEILNDPKKGSAIQTKNNALTITIENYIIDGENFDLDSSIRISHPLEFNNCTFNYKDGPMFISLMAKHGVLFEGCSFSGSVHFIGGEIIKELAFKYVHVKAIHFSRGSFEKISISCYDMKKLWVSGIIFKSLHVGEYLLGDNISELSVFGKENETGDIYTKDQGFESIFLTGTNKNRKYEFENIRCNQILFFDFVNDGDLNFFGIRPKDATFENRYFQIINSNLHKAQFFRAFFSSYIELILIDSFITECLFVGCRWSDNVRALRGPGFPVFEESKMTGRKILVEENFAIREAYRQLKISMSQHSDKIQEQRFYSEELKFHNKTLNWVWPNKNQFWDKVILHLSRIFSNNGQSVLRPLLGLLVGHLILVFIAIYFGGFQDLTISFNNANKVGFEKAFEIFLILINPLRKEIPFSGYLVLVDVLMRIWSSYMIYNIIRASRRFIS